MTTEAKDVEHSESIAFRAGRDAHEAGVALERSALRNLRPDSQQYSDFIAGYDSRRSQR